jgi:hypothetical protein
MKSGKKLKMNLSSLTGNARKKEQVSQGNTATNSSRTILPPPIVETVVSSSQSLTSSIGIGEFGMNISRTGNAATFAVAVKNHLFPKLKFLKGTNASLDFSKENTSICGFLRVKCGVAEDDAHQWWDDHRIMLKNIHTDFRNNKIKMVKQQFIGKLQ